MLNRAYLVSMMVDSIMMLKYGKNLSLYALSADSISAHPKPFSHSRHLSSLPALIMAATRGVMEILGLDPYQSQTQYLGLFHRDSRKRKYSGNLFLPYFLFISTLFPLQKHTKSTEAIFAMMAMNQLKLCSGKPEEAAPGDEKKILTLREAAAFLNCSKAHLSHAINGRIAGIPILPHISIGRRKLILRSSLLEWMERIETHRA